VGGDYVESGLPVFSGGGQSQFTGGSLTLTTDVIPGLTMGGGILYLEPSFQGGSVTNLTLSAMTLEGQAIVSGILNLGAGLSGSLRILSNGMLNWSGGRIYGALTLASNGVLNISGLGQSQFLAGVLTNYGTINWLGGDLNIANDNGGYDQSGAIYNQPGGIFDIQCDRSLLNQYYNYFYNGYFTGSGFFSNAGTLRKSAGASATLVSGAFSNSATVEVLSGTISFLDSSSLTTGPASATVVSLNAAMAASAGSVIQCTTPQEWNGTFRLIATNGVRPNPGNTFPVLSCPSATGAFTCLIGLDLGGGIVFQPRLTQTGLNLVAVSYPTNSTQPLLFISGVPGNKLLITWPVGFPTWALQSSTNLTAPVWTPLSLTCDSQALVPITRPAEYFRLRKN
jgi:hypothetical protein